MDEVNQVLKNIRAKRISMGFTQDTVAGKIGMEQGNYAGVENGHRRLTVELLFRIADALETTIFRLVVGVHNGANYDGLYDALHSDLTDVIKKYEEMYTKMNFLNQL